MSLLGRLFGSSKATESLINHAAKGLDKLYYSSEEKAEDAAEARRANHSMFIEWMKSTSGSRLARRCIALVVTAIWSLQYITAQILSIAAVWSEVDAESLKKSAQIITENAESANGAMMLVLAFYFAAPHMGSIVDSAMKKFSGP